ncbi:hypothetical protein DIPPA_05026 [Diplonema papillatum]|nr:hypothetical protein DIPPA_05026 [Diplonema papillatum]
MSVGPGLRCEAVPAAALCPLPDEGLAEALREMGFAEEAARQTLQNSHNKSDLAITLLTQEIRSQLLPSSQFGPSTARSSPRHPKRSSLLKREGKREGC